MKKGNSEELKGHIEYFEKQIKRLGYRLYYAEKRENEEDVQNISTKMNHYRAAISALTLLSAKGKNINDEQKALLGDQEAAKRLTEKGVKLRNFLN